MLTKAQTTIFSKGIVQPDGSPDTTWLNGRSQRRAAVRAFSEAPAFSRDSQGQRRAGMVGDVR